MAGAAIIDVKGRRALGFRQRNTSLPRHNHFAVETAFRHGR
jgi:hypothetical protein